MNGRSGRATPYRANSTTAWLPLCLPAFMVSERQPFGLGSAGVEQRHNASNEHGFGKDCALHARQHRTSSLDS